AAGGGAGGAADLAPHANATAAARARLGNCFMGGSLRGLRRRLEAGVHEQTVGVAEAAGRLHGPVPLDGDLLPDADLGRRRGLLELFDPTGIALLVVAQRARHVHHPQRLLEAGVGGIGEVEVGAVAYVGAVSDDLLPDVLGASGDVFLALTQLGVRLDLLLAFFGGARVEVVLVHDEAGDLDALVQELLP